MKAIKATYKNGQVVLDEPGDWPDGTDLWVMPVTGSAAAGERDGSGIQTPEAEQHDDPESIARWIAAFEAIPPLQMTPEEGAEWQAARQARKEFDKATFNERAEKLRRMWVGEVLQAEEE